MEPEEVERIQEACNLILNTDLAVDGIWGSNTEEAVMEFQEKAGIGADGIVGPKTKQAFIKMLQDTASQANELVDAFAYEGGDKEEMEDMDYM